VEPRPLVVGVAIVSFSFPALAFIADPVPTALIRHSPGGRLLRSTSWGALIVVGLILAAAAPALTQDEPERVSEPFEASQGQAGGSELLGPQAAVIVLDSKGQEVGPFLSGQGCFSQN
jgi:hypothetical protein